MTSSSSSKCPVFPIHIPVFFHIHTTIQHRSLVIFIEVFQSHSKSLYSFTSIISFHIIHSLSPHSCFLLHPTFPSTSTLSFHIHSPPPHSSFPLHPLSTSTFQFPSTSTFSLHIHTLPPHSCFPLHPLSPSTFTLYLHIPVSLYIHPLPPHMQSSSTSPSPVYASHTWLITQYILSSTLSADPPTCQSATKSRVPEPVLGEECQCQN
ncbi:hypothetical protein Pcinc_008466 [Petrolisthes cinctipes]|uniref:Uncharacterized protein n=1 Tax=Petrolisthes cinctipes TaxID=88211 RepID=A0AAE1G7B2_PETCI|nr:hypothetical protein Pcinc_008466 [Petrolisthes cinctipes]